MLNKPFLNLNKSPRLEAEIRAARFQGLIKMVVTRGNGAVQVVDWFPNLVLDAGLDRIAAGNAIVYVSVGTNSTPPATTDTALLAHVAYTNTGSPLSGAGGYLQESTPYFYEYTWGFRFNAGQATGNLNEVGIGWGTSGTNLFARSLIKDPIGDPFTLVIDSIDILDIFYKIRCYPPIDDLAISFTAAGTTHNGTSRALGLTTNNLGYAGRSYRTYPGAQIGFSGFDTNYLYWGGGTVTLAQRERDMGWTIPTGTNNGYTGVDATEGWYGNGFTGTSGGLGYGFYWSTVGSYTPGSYTLPPRRFHLGINVINFPTGIGGVLIPLNYSYAQMNWSPVVPKNNTKTFELDLTVSWGRYTP